MNKEKVLENCNQLIDYSSVILEKVETYYKSKTKWNVDELGKVVDILKDVSQIHKNCAKCCKIFNENSLEEF